MGLFGFLGKAAGFAGQFLPGPAGTALQIGGRLLSGGGAGPPPPRGPQVRPGQIGFFPRGDDVRGRQVSRPLQIPARPQTRQPTRITTQVVDDPLFGGKVTTTRTQQFQVAAEIEAQQAQVDQGCVCGGQGKCGFCCLTSGKQGRKNRSGYYVQIEKGNPAAGGRWIPPGALCVQRRRRFNNANGRAQGRSIRRLEAGEDHAKRLLKAMGYRKISKGG